MRRLVRAVVTAGFVAACLYLLPAYTLSAFTAQTARVRWETWHQGAAYTTAVTEDENFSNCFVVDGTTATVGGSAFFRGDAFSCTWAVDGVGAGDMVMTITHEDAGVDCLCTVGACTAGPNTELECACASTFQMVPGSTYCMKADTTSSCGTSEPGQWHCSMDLFR